MGEAREQAGGRGTPSLGHFNTLGDDIRSFLSQVPAFPLSPGAALADIHGLAPLSPGLGPAASSYHFALSPARHQDPPSPSRYFHTDRPTSPRPGLALHSPRILSPPRALLDSPHRVPSTANSPRRFLGSPLRVTSRPHSPDIHHHSPINLHTFHREPFGSPRPEAWSPPPYEQEPGPYPSHFLPPSSSHPLPYPLTRSPRRPRSPSPTSSPRHHAPRGATPPPPAHSYLRSSDYHYSFSPAYARPYSPYQEALRLPEHPRPPSPGPAPYLRQEREDSREALASPSPRLESPPPPQPKPLSKAIVKRLAGQAKSKGGRREAKRPKVHKRRQEVPRKEEGVLESGEGEVARMLATGCGCGLGCLEGVEPGGVARHRSNIGSLSRSDHDMYLMGLLMATMVSPGATSKRKERQRSRNKYMFQGREVCLEAFLYLENVTVYHLKAMRSHLLEQGVMPRKKNGGQTRRQRDQALEEHHSKALVFLKEQLSRSGESVSCRSLHRLYSEHFRDSPAQALGFSAFRTWAVRMFPGLRKADQDAISLPRGVAADTQIRLEMGEQS